MTRYLLAGLWIAACAPGQAFPEAAGPDRVTAVVEISIDMVELADPTTETFLAWQRDINAGFLLGLDGATKAFALEGPGRILERALLFSLLTDASLIVNQAFSLTAHDSRHMEAARAIGSPSVYLVSNATGQRMGIWQFFLEAFNFTAEPALYFWQAPASVTLADQAYVAGAGLDANLLTAVQISRSIDDGEGQVMELAPYVLNKLWGVHYFMVTGITSDATTYMDAVAQQGYRSVTQTNVIALNAVSGALSGGFLALAAGTWGYVVDGSTAVAPLGATLGPVRLLWPEVTPWLNADNVSVDVTMDAQWEDSLTLRVGADVPALGNTGARAEVTVGARAGVRPVTVGLELTSNGNGFPFLQASAEAALGGRVSIGLNGFYGKGTTMREAREHPRGPGLDAYLKAAL
ncbi:MAG TPA: hypothetical protein VFI08_08140 [Spirochaetia bacterium]|nr:hypothetical protein [Spirochaetia bacterium]